MDDPAAALLWTRIEKAENRAEKADAAYRELDAHYSGFRVSIRELQEKTLAQWNAERVVVDAEIARLKREKNSYKFKPHLGFFAGPDYNFSEGRIGGIKVGFGLVMVIF